MARHPVNSIARRVAAYAWASPNTLLGLIAGLLVLAFGLGAIEVVVQQARLTDAAADGARSVARGDGEGVMHARTAGLVGPASVSVHRAGDFVCVTLAQPAAGPAAVTGLSVHGEGCALGDDPINQKAGS